MMNQQLNHDDREMSRALYDELAALKIRIAFAEIDEDELDEYDRELASVSESDYSEAAQKRTLKLIEHKLNKRLHRQFVRKTLPRTLQLVSIALLVFFIGLTTAVATVRPVRLRIMDFIAQIEENYSAVSIDYNDNDNIVPQEWQGNYFPNYIPDGFVFSHVDDLFNTVHYITSDDRVLQYSEFEDTVYSNVDIDNENALDITINGISGIAMTNKESTTIIWCIDNTYLYLYYSGDLRTAKHIACSVKSVLEF